MANSKYSFYDNSFDVISLIAALWVMLSHTIAWMFYNGDGSAFVLSRITNPGPAVSIFFFISGFLCANSYAKSKCVKDFYLKRLIRIYPALLVVLILPVLIWGLMGYMRGVEIDKVIIHIVRSLFVLNSGWIPPYAIENGSLWTIPIQMQFYILTPLLMLCIVRTRKWMDIILWVSTLTFCIFNTDIRNMVSLPIIPWYDRLCHPYLYLYLGGILCQKYFDTIVPKMVRLLPFMLFSFILSVWVLNIAPVFLKSIVICSIALGSAYKYGRCNLRYDISYGLYLWHLPIASMLLYSNPANHLLLLISCWSLSLFAGYISFKYIEKPLIIYINEHILRKGPKCAKKV